MADELGDERTLQTTPTWAVATICFILISFSILIDYFLHLLAKYFNRKRRKALIQALEKIKSELMLLGFISLLLTVSEKPIANICIPKSVAETFLPCGSASLAETVEEAKCDEQGKMSLLSRSGVRELQYLIFVLASFHSLSCVLIFGLGMAKMRKWELWEAETRTLEYQFSKDPRRLLLTHQTSFGKRHLRWSENRLLRWPILFLRQFQGSVSKVDYLTLRHGFIMAHFEQGSNFDFQKYIKRALEKDLRVVVGISLWIWIFSVFYIFFNAQKFHSYLWLPFIPLVLLLLVNTKFQGIMTGMCLDSHDKSHVVRGTLLVRPSDHFFWFNWPKLLLHLIHFILFQNSFQLAFFTWTWFKFGLRSCFHREIEDIVIRLAMGLLVHFLCGYVTLPLYALVTQMGTSMNKAVFTENVERGLMKWKDRARKNLKKYNKKARLSIESSPSFSVDASNIIDCAEHVAIEVTNAEETETEAEEGRQKQEEEHKRTDSFQGFDTNKTNGTS